jgi:hypothetical protein
VTSLVSVLEACPLLVEIDLCGSYLAGQSDELFQALITRPHLRIYINHCNGVYRKHLSFRGAALLSSDAADDSAIPAGARDGKTLEHAHTLSEQLVGVRCPHADAPRAQPNNLELILPQPSVCSHCSSAPPLPAGRADACAMVIKERYGWPAWSQPQAQAGARDRLCG